MNRTGKTEKKRGPAIVAIGGGTGLPNLLRGLKNLTDDLTAVVTVADNGGGTGRLRRDMGIVAPGDIRNCILALADAEPIMTRLFGYRFQGGELDGQSFGNIYLAAMGEVAGGFLESVRYTSDILAVRGEVLPVTLSNVELCAQLTDGSIIMGESQIPQASITRSAVIRQVFLNHACRALPAVLEAIRRADVIIYGPGSLYTSVIANLLPDGVCDAIRESRAMKLAVSNLMTQPGETDGYRLSDHAAAILAHRGTLNGIIYNCNTALSQEVSARYAAQNAFPVEADEKRCIEMGITPYGFDLVQIGADGRIRHDEEALGRAVLTVYRQRSFRNSIRMRRIREH